MKMRAIGIAAGAMAAAGVIGASAVLAQEAPPKATPSGTVKPDTSAATSMFGPPPPAVVFQDGRGKPVTPQSNTGVRPVSGSEPASPPPLFFPHAQPPKPDLPAPKITVESSTPEPKPLPIVPAIPAPTAPPPLAVTPPPAAAPAFTPAPSGPQPLTITPRTLNGIPNLPLSAKATPSVMIECIAPNDASVGQNVDYVLVVRNTGSSAVANVRVEDELPMNAKLVASEPACEQGERLAWSLGTLDAGSERRIKITVKPADEGELRSRAMVTFSSVAEAKVKITRPRIALALTGAESVRVGDEVPFQVKITNTGSGPATNLIVKAKLSDGLHHPAGTQIEAMIERLAVGESKVITLRALATKAGANGCNITAGMDGLAAEVAATNVAIVEPMLTAKVNGPTKCLVQQQPEYRIELANPGSASTDPVSVWAVVPEGFEFVQASDTGTYQAASRVVMWNLPALAMGGNRTLSMKLKATASSEGLIKIVAQSTPPAENGVVAASAKGNPARTIEVKAETAVKAEGMPNLRFEVVDAEDPVEVGKDATYDIRIVNQGTANCTNVLVTATLADGTTASGATGPTATRGQGQVISFDPLPTLAAKGEVIYRVKVRGLQPGDLKIKVSVSCDEIRTPTTKEENTRFFKD